MEDDSWMPVPGGTLDRQLTKMLSDISALRAEKRALHDELIALKREVRAMKESMENLYQQWHRFQIAQEKAKR